jgi:hypothetical protein
MGPFVVLFFIYLYSLFITVGILPSHTITCLILLFVANGARAYIHIHIGAHIHNALSPLSPPAALYFIYSCRNTHTPHYHR